MAHQDSDAKPSGWWVGAVLIGWVLVSLALVIVLGVSACSSTARPATPQPPVVVQPTPTCNAMISVFEGDPAQDVKLPGVLVQVGDLGGTTDAAGNVVLGPFSDGLVVYPVRVTKDGWRDVDEAPDGTRSVFTGLTPCTTTAVRVSMRRTTPPAFIPRELRGRVRLSGRVFVDDDGPRSALGASLFWLAWGYQHDRERTEANLRWLAEHDVDFVRAFAEVCGGTWADREVRPDWPDYTDVLVGATRMANAHGLRVEWTLFGGGCVTSAEAVVVGHRAVDALRTVSDGVQFVEVTNEQMMSDVTAMREVAAYARHAGFVVALTGTPEKGLPALYQGSAADLATVHFDRQDGDYGWRFARQSWGYWELEHMPPAFVNNEPAGIAGSVRAENDPVKLASDALVTWVSGGAAYVLHHGAGIYGRAYTHPTAGARQANVWEQPALEQALALIAKVRAVLPPDVPNWTRVNNHWTAPNPVPPFRFRMEELGDAATRERGLTRAFTAQRGDDFVTVLLGVRGALDASPARPVEATAYDLRDWQARPWTGSVNGADTTVLVRAVSR